MRLMFILGLLLFSAVGARADIQPEEVGREMMAAPGAGWFLVESFNAAWFFDSHTGEMQGSLSLSEYTPAVEPNLPKGEFYSADSFYSRGVRGERDDVLTIWDAKTLSPKGEVPIPKKTATLWFRNYISLLDDDRHVVVFNMTPAQSVSVVDVARKKFVGEIATSGCALILPEPNRAFLMLCGDGTLQLIRLDTDGKEAKRVRSEKFFDIEADPVFDQVARTETGWILLSHAGNVFQVKTDKDRIEISKPFPILTQADEGWRPGGYQPLGFHRDSHVLYILMHEGGVDTHYESGTEVWLVDIDRGKRIGRFALDEASKAVQVTQEAVPLLLTLTDKGSVDVYDGQLLRRLRSIDGVGPSPLFLQTLGRHD
ncbi:MAG: hypothetical protein KDI19_04705 [Pseudomonadales bacterium]|nr:hypothetical protein [Pseudomonadales bacterium]